MIVEAVKGVTNFIGRLGENEARVMRFPIREMLNEFPGCTFTLANRRPNDADAYPSPNIVVNGDFLDWTVTSGDLASVGFGECEVIASVDGKVMKSDIYQTVIKTALDDSGTVPEPWEGWVTEVTEAAEQAEAAVEHYPKIIEGYWYVWQDDAWVSTGEKAQGEQGEQGDPGDPGAPGQDGVSPTVDVEEITGGHRVTITDAEGDHTFDVMDGQSGGGGTSDYEDLSNKPQIGGVELVGNKSLSDLGAASTSDVSAKYTKPGTGIPSSDMASAVQTSLGKADTAYQKPSDGIPASDIASGVIPDPTSIIDDTAGDGDTNKVWSADKVNDLKSQIQEKYTKPQGGIPASDIADGVIPSLNPQDVADAVSDWCDENITEDPTVVIDKSLSISGAAADAAKTGRINKAVFGTYTEHTLESSELESGVWAYSSKSTNSKRLRIKQLNPVTKGTIIQYTNPTLQVYFGVLATTSSTSYLEVTGWITAGKSNFRYEVQNDGYLVINIGSSNNISVSDYDCTITITKTTKEGVISPNRMGMLAKDNANPMYSRITDLEETTTNGVTYSISNGVATFSGTASAQFHILNYGSTTSLLDFQIGKKYFIKIDKTGTGDVYVVLSTYDSNQTFIKDIVEVRNSASFIIDSLTGVSGMSLRYRIKSGAVLNCSVQYTISEVPSTNYLSDNLSTITGKYSESLYPDLDDKAESTSRGITYSIKNGLARFYGTSESNGTDFRANRIGWSNIMLSDFKVGKKYFVSLNKTGTGKVGVELSLYDRNGTHIGDAFDAYEDTSFVINSLTGISGMLIRYHIPQGQTVNCTISYTISEVPSNAYLLNRKTVFSIMQYNIGKYTWGNSSMHITTEETGSHLSFDEYVANYRKFLCKYHPDIIGIEEYLPTTNVEVSGSSPTEYETESMKELIFDPVYPFDSEFVEIVEGETVHRQRCLKSKIGKPVDVSYKWDSVTINGETAYMPSVVAHYNIDGKRVCCVCHGMPWVHGDAYITARNTLLASILDKYADEEYCFIALDMNNGGNDSTVTSKDEAESLLTMAKSKGWNFAMGGYLPFEKTYIPNTPSEHYNNLMLDNIIYRDNGKTILRDFKVLMDEYENLTSDHVPVIGEFILL